MKRLQAFAITFGIGLVFVYLLALPYSLGFEDVPPIAVAPLTVETASFSTEEPKFTAFFDSFDKDAVADMWLIPDEFKGMKEVWTVLLSSDNPSNKNQWSAMIFTTDPNGDANETDDFSSNDVKVDSDGLRFETKTSRGIKYSLEGRFLYGGSNLSDGETVFRGTMKKFINGKLKATFTKNFKYYEPKCWH